MLCPCWPCGTRGCVWLQNQIEEKKLGKVSSEIRDLNCESFIPKYLRGRKSPIEIWISFGNLHMRNLNQATIPSYTLGLMFTVILSVKCISSMPTKLLDAYTVYSGGDTMPWKITLLKIF